MSLQVTAGYGSLVSLGIGLADVFTLITLASRLGNWWTTSSGDAGFLDLLEEDEQNLLSRRGLIDLARFNKRWGKSLNLLADGKPQRLQGPNVEQVLGELSRFTACVTCIVAVLFECMEESTARIVLKQLLLRLVRTTERGGDLLASQLTVRLNAWRSNAKVRGLSIECQRLRAELVQQNLMLDGFVPTREKDNVVQALHWLLAGDTELFTTNSSDVAALVMCLEHLCFDLVSVEWPDKNPPERACRLVYKPNLLTTGSNATRRAEAEILVRPPSTTVSLLHPEESLTTFPITANCANRCRLAWKNGARAARYLRIQVAIPSKAQVRNAHDLHYSFVNLGGESERIETEVFALCLAYGLVPNQELCQALKEALSRESEETLNWVKCQTEENILATDTQINHYWKTDPVKVEAFTVCQAFFMGYYYAAFLSIVDTSSLEIQTVDGAWGYRSAALLSKMRQYCHRIATHGGLSREDLIIILASLLFSHTTKIPPPRREQWCLGVIGKRTLLVNSLIGSCKSPADIGRFVLLDVDVGSIPADISGLVKPGVPESPTHQLTEKPAVENIRERGPDMDFTKHIEADWDGNPETILLCFRYNGRRIGSVNPAVADVVYCHAYVERVENPQPRQPLLAIECDLSDFLEDRVIFSSRALILVQAYGRPCMRYAAVALYGKSYLLSMALSTNCIHTAIRQILDKTSQIVISGEGP